MTPGLAPEVYARLLHDEQGRPLGYVPAPAGELRMGVGAPTVLLLRSSRAMSTSGRYVAAGREGRPSVDSNGPVAPSVRAHATLWHREAS